MRKLAIITIIALFAICLLGAFGANKEDAESEIKLPIIMYHSVSSKGNSRYIVTPRQLESDIAALKKAGYTAVLPSEVLLFVEGKGSLPKKPIMLTFDDGHYNNLSCALPTIKENSFKAVVSIVGKFCENSTNSFNDGKRSAYLTWDEVKELAGDKSIEIGCHTYDMHNYEPRFGIKKKTGETETEYREALTRDITKWAEVLENKAGLCTEIFAYPFGAYHTDSHTILGDLGYRVIFTTNEKINIIKKGDIDALKKLGRFNRESKYSSCELLCKISGAD